MDQSLLPSSGYVTSLARWARILEIVIPTYMFGKSWGAADERNVHLFEAQFPPFLIQATEAVKHALSTNNEPLQRIVATTSGALIALAVVTVYAVLLHAILRDRRFVDSLRFTAVTLIPIAVMNGMLSHGVQTLVNQMKTRPINSLEFGVLYLPWIYFVLNVAFYLLALWMMGKRTGVAPAKRWQLIGVGAVFVGCYLAAGLMIFPAEWNALILQVS